MNSEILNKIVYHFSVTKKPAPQQEPVEDSREAYIHSTDGRRFQIEMISSTDKEECLEFLLHTDDPLINALGLPSDPLSMQCLRLWLDKLIDQGLTFGCFGPYPDQAAPNARPPLVAVDVVYVRHENDYFPVNMTDVTGEAFKNYLKIIRAVERRVWYEKEKRNFLTFMMSFGITINPAYMGIDIETKMLNKRHYNAALWKINRFRTVFVGERWETIAERLNYKSIYEFDLENSIYNDIIPDTGDVFPIKIMVKWIPKLKALQQPHKRAQRERNSGSAVSSRSNSILVDAYLALEIDSATNEGKMATGDSHDDVIMNHDEVNNDVRDNHDPNIINVKDESILIE